MATIDDLKLRIDLHDLANRLGLDRRADHGNYRSPKHDDQSPSLSIYQDGKRWKDFSTDEGGTCVDLVMYVHDCDIGAAIKLLHEMYGIPLEERRAPPRDKSWPEQIAERCLRDPARLIGYLAGRGISDSVIRAAIITKTAGFNDWESEKIPANQPMHGGAAAAFIVQTLNPGHVAAVDMRYLDPALNGGVKTSCQGERAGYGWTSDIARLKKAETVYVVESPINALSIETASIPRSAAYATRGTSNVRNIDFHFLAGKRVLICMDHDAPDQRGRRPGLEAAWALHERLLAIDVPAQLVDQDEWQENDVNDVLQKRGADGLKLALKKIEPWLIPGLPGKGTENLGRPRIFLPGHDYAKYWRFRVKSDFTSYVDKVEKNEEGAETPSLIDLSGFRVAAIARVSIAGITSTMTGEADTSPRVQFAVSVQTPRAGNKLVRKVIEDEKVHNLDSWRRFGPIFNPQAFLRMINVLERTADIGARRAINFVGLAWRDGALVVNEGPDCYFTKPEQQCPYHALVFPSGSRHDARAVIAAYQQTFTANAACLALVWALGAHLKVLLGFWPHLAMQADKGAGKSTLIKRLERSIAFTMFSGQNIQTEYRQLTSLSYTSHPVGWEEISARKVEIIDRAVSMLQEAYQYAPTFRGAEMTPFLLSAPVLLAGEDVPVRGLTGKLIRTDLTGKKGLVMAADLPQFPVRQWLEFLSGQSVTKARAAHAQIEQYCHSRSRAMDQAALRIVGNYAAVLTAWRYLAEFAGIESGQGDFSDDLIAEMNAHIADTHGEREPWVWIVETLFSEIAANEFRFPFLWEAIGGEPCLLVRTSHVMDHLARTTGLREKWAGLPVKSDRVFKKQLHRAGVLLTSGDDMAHFERSIGASMSQPGKRVSYMVALSLNKLIWYGIYAAPDAHLLREADPPPDPQL